MDGGANAHIRCATADISPHRIVDVCITGITVVCEQRGGAHYLARLAITALNYVKLLPSGLNRLGGLLLRPSIVMICFPLAAETGVLQERTGAPFK